MRGWERGEESEGRDSEHHLAVADAEDRHRALLEHDVERHDGDALDSAQRVRRREASVAVASRAVRLGGGEPEEEAAARAQRGAGARDAEDQPRESEAADRRVGEEQQASERVSRRRRPEKDFRDRGAHERSQEGRLPREGGPALQRRVRQRGRDGGVSRRRRDSTERSRAPRVALQVPQRSRVRRDRVPQRAAREGDLERGRGHLQARDFYPAEPRGSARLPRRRAREAGDVVR
mmetsp:Transcript_9931/g.36086  ORF Transcript_9931/g.36086 Transcript_9931/m.36086 type:complete len:235 (+) Transcript_9931:656-1360(+)